MSLSKDQDSANTNDAPELSAEQLDQVAGGDPVVVTKTVSSNQTTTAQKAADKTDAYIRS